jgi:hypothetical protein
MLEQLELQSREMKLANKSKEEVERAKHELEASYARRLKEGEKEKQDLIEQQERQNEQSRSGCIHNFTTSDKMSGRTQLSEGINPHQTHQ